MSNDDYIDPIDIESDYCERNHAGRRDPECVNCDLRAERVHCATCGASFEDGRWFTGVGSTAPNGCDHEALVDDWDDEIRCQTLVAYPTTSRRPAYHAPCRDTVAAPGKSACAHHQRWLDQDECGRIYQRMVAAR